MKQIIVHGVLVGQEIVGTFSDEDKNYCQRFYSENFTKQDSCLFVEIIPAKKRVYYTYVRGNLVSAEKRQGSYFALTLSADELCRHIYSLFELFNQFYETYVMKDLLTRDGNVTRYKVKSFEQGSSIKGYEKKILDRLSVASEDFLFDKYDFPFSRQSHGHNPMVRVSLKDVDSPDFFEQLEKSQRVFVSPSIPSQRLMIEDLKDNILQRDAETEKKENAILNLRTELDALRKEIDATRKSCDKIRNDYETRFKEMPQKTKIFESIRDLYKESSKQTETLAKLLENKNDGVSTMVEDPRPPHPLPSKKRKRILSLAIVLLLLILLLFTWSEMETWKKAESTKTEQIDNINSEKKSTNLSPVK